MPHKRWHVIQQQQRGSQSTKVGASGFWRLFQMVIAWAILPGQPAAGTSSGSHARSHHHT
eukprot:1161587-Pelagomonas_calceolata.AAC.10